MRVPRLFAAALAAALLAVACGEDEPALIVPESGSTTTAADGPVGGDCEEATPVDAQPELTLDVRAQGALRAGEPVTWVVELTNWEDEPVELTFRSGQDGDVVLLRGGGEEAYRWSEGMFFTQALRCRTVQATGSFVFELRGTSLDVAPGEYTLRATLAAEPAPPPVERTVTVEP